MDTFLPARRRGEEDRHGRTDRSRAEGDSGPQPGAGHRGAVRTGASAGESAASRGSAVGP